MQGRGSRIGNADRTHVLGLLDGARTAGLLPTGEYDARVARAGTATYASELADQLAGLPPPYVWQAPPPAPAAGRVALILGVASVPFSICGIGAVLGILAVVASRGAPRGTRVSPALIGRVFGILGIALSIAAVAAMIYARAGRSAP